MEVKIIDSIHFKNHTLPVHGNLDESLFKATDVAELLSHGGNNIWNLTDVCEDDKKLVLPAIVGGQRRRVTFVTGMGPYNVLTQSRRPIIRAQRRVVTKGLIALRWSRRKNVSKQFEDWNHQADVIYFDEENDMLMRSVIVPDGDVERVPYEP